MEVIALIRSEKQKKLSTLPWQALFDLAISFEIPAEELKGKDKCYIIDKLLDSSNLEDDKINWLIDEYIYGNRVTFTIWEFEKNLTDTEYSKLTDLDGSTENYLDIKGFRNLNVMSVQKHEDRFEILYVYSKEYAYINEDGKNDSVWELHRGCVWIGIEKAYIACISKHDHMTSYIIDYLHLKLGINITQIKPPKSALEKCISVRSMSRITLQKTDGGKTIISKSDGFTADQEDEIERIKNGRLDTSGSYIADISSNTYATIKYNIKKGSISIFKHLSSKELFKWTHQAIKIILDEIEQLKGRPAEEIFAELGLQIKWNRLCTGHETALNWLLTQVITSQSNETDFQIQIPDFVNNILFEPKLFIRLPRIYCEECDSYEIPICAECGEVLKYLDGSNLKCTCGAPLSIICGEGHSRCRQADWYIPTEKLKLAIQNNYQTAFQGQEANFNMCITGYFLNIVNKRNDIDSEVEVSFNNIDEFKHELSKDFTTCQEYAVRLNEKCNYTCSNSKIRICTSTSSDVCLPKIFWGIINGFRPQPHKGLEYGDVSGQIKVNNTNLEFKGIIKKNSENKGRTPKMSSQLIESHLLSTSKEGEEIIRQFVEQGLNDQRCQVIAVIAPQYFDASFKGTLRYLARLGGKKILFIELDEVSKIISMNSNIIIKKT